MPVQTSSYDGFGTWPPQYPTRASTTPAILRKVASTSQKQPAAKVAASRLSCSVGLVIAGKIALHIPLLHCLAFVIQFLAAGEPQFQLGIAALIEEQFKRNQG